MYTANSCPSDEEARMTDPTPRLFTGLRGVRYGEVLAVYLRDDGLHAEVYGTQMLNDCPQELWQTLDAATIAQEMGATFVKLNGPRHWMIDGAGPKVAVVEPVLRDFNGLTMRRIATLELGPSLQAQPYTIRHVNRGAVFFFDAGRPVHELVDPDGTAYVMQAYCIGVDPSLTQDALASLGDRLALPEGWTYRTRVLDAELVVDTSNALATVIQDELENTYTLP
jgi:hypothetical protein